MEITVREAFVELEQQRYDLPIAASTFTKGSQLKLFLFIFRIGLYFAHLNAHPIYSYPSKLDSLSTIIKIFRVTLSLSLCVANLAVS